MEFNSRRSPVYGTRGMVAASQPLAAEAGMRILQKGGNAADAAVAVAAALNVTEPTSCGIGGDMFTLFYNNSNKTVSGVNGSGRAPAGLTLEHLANIGIKDEMPAMSIHTITVPGAVAGMIDTLERFGTMDISEVLQPAIELAKSGFPVSLITSYYWKRGVSQLRNGPYAQEMLIDDRAPEPGEKIKLSALANTFNLIAEHGKAGFYEGEVAQAIVDLLEPLGSMLTLDDLKNHKSTFDDPISVNYRNKNVYEIPPNGQGLTALLALNILEEYEFNPESRLSAKHLHLMIEALRIAFADTRWYIADPTQTHVPVKELLSKDYAIKRRSLLNPHKATVNVVKGSPTASSDTVYFTTADKEGNACSFIFSNYMGFGTGLIPKNCGFTLQNRGAGFSLNPNHPNALAPNKRPYHTIIPSMVTDVDTKELYCSFGVMGGFMQPQGHVQVLINLVDYNLDPQAALDAPRFCITDGTAGGNVALEEGIQPNVMKELTKIGHTIIPTSGYERSIFGRGQIIRRNPSTGVYTAGSDPRADGLVYGW